MVYVWLASNVGKLRVLSRSVRTGRQALCGRTLRALSEPPSLLEEVHPHRVYAFLRLEVRGRYTPLMVQTPDERAQLHFWEAVLDRDTFQ